MSIGLTLKEIKDAAAVNAVRIYAEMGWQQQEIAARLDTSRETVRKYADLAGVKFKRGRRPAHQPTPSQEATA